MAGSSPPAALGRIFISYRREETAYPAGWLYDRLADRYGGGQVFKDVDSIQLGDDFVEVVTRAVGSCDVLLALIGDQWLAITDEHGRRRLDDPDDFVRLEIEAALTRNVRVIPILVDGARMPHAEELPASLVKLVRRQALELSPARFEFDTSRLLDVLDWTLADVRTASDDGALEGASTGKLPHPNAAPVEKAPASPEQEQQGLTSAPASPPREAQSPSDRGAVLGQRRRLSTWARILAVAAASVALTLLIVAIVANTRTGSPTTTTSADGQGANNSSGGIDVDSTPVTGPDEIRLTELKAASSSDSPSLGDTVTVTYSLTNVGDKPIQLAYTFVGVRNPSGDNRDTEDMNEDRVLAPGETVNAQGRRQLDEAGSWEFWPCYEVSGGRQCPDKWQVFFVLAE